ncbi:hypothetical protein HMPREF3223_01522 [Cutibacterium avidum]|nr:hypothetical protein HMPREF3223_01522 [Cutibacterium avidum]
MHGHWTVADSVTVMCGHPQYPFDASSPTSWLPHRPPVTTATHAIAPDVERTLITTDIASHA